MQGDAHTKMVEPTWAERKLMSRRNRRLRRGQGFPFNKVANPARPPQPSAREIFVSAQPRLYIVDPKTGERARTGFRNVIENRAWV